MSKLDKLKARLCSKPKDMTFEELSTLLKGMGYVKKEGTGSRVKFIKADTKQVISLHSPHNPKFLKEYVIKDVIAVLGIC
ncbi:MAG: type II toxin-antitoxin system HicA family toxin [Adhaeribacter sp.]